MSFLCRTSVQALRSSTGYSKVGRTVNHWISAVQRNERRNLWVFDINYRFTQPLIMPELDYWAFAFFAVYTTGYVCVFLYCKSSLVLFVSVFVIHQGGKPFQWEFVHGLLESAIYGGRIDNPSDLRILRSYLEQFFSSQLFSSSISTGQRKSRGGLRFFPPQISLPNSCSILVGDRVIYGIGICCCLLCAVFRSTSLYLLIFFPYIKS